MGSAGGAAGPSKSRQPPRVSRRGQKKRMSAVEEAARRPRPRPMQKGLHLAVFCLRLPPLCCCCEQLRCCRIGCLAVPTSPCTHNGMQELCAQQLAVGKQDLGNIRAGRLSSCFLQAPCQAAVCRVQSLQVLLQAQEVSAAILKPRVTSARWSPLPSRCNRHRSCKTCSFWCVSWLL